MPHGINYKASGQIASRHITLLSSILLSDSSYEFKCLSSAPEKRVFCHWDPLGRTFRFPHSAAFYPLCHSRKDQPISCSRIFSVHVFVKRKLRIRSPINAKASRVNMRKPSPEIFLFYVFFLPNWRVEDYNKQGNHPGIQILCLTGSHCGRWRWNCARWCRSCYRKNRQKRKRF